MKIKPTKQQATNYFATEIEFDPFQVRDLQHEEPCVFSFFYDWMGLRSKFTEANIVENDPLFVVRVTPSNIYGEAIITTGEDDDEGMVLDVFFDEKETTKLLYLILDSIKK